MSRNDRALVQPRIATFENVPDLLASRHCHAIGEILASFTSNEYNVRWKVVPFVELGLPQLRERLIVIAAR